MRRVAFSLFVLLVVAGRSHADRWIVTLDEQIAAEPATGRVILFFITETGPYWDRVPPVNAPFYEAPQPIASIEVVDFKPGDAVTLDDAAISFPKPLSELDGSARVQAVFDHDDTQRGHRQGRGNAYSEVKAVELSSDRDETFHLTLTNVFEEPELPPDRSEEDPNLIWVEYRSELLSEFYGRDVYHRAGVALPMPYLEEEQNKPEDARDWPARYIVPGFGSRHYDVLNYAQMFRAPGIEEVAPMAVTIVLDPESPLGHHGFIDNENHGPRGTALVTELIPHLEEKLRLVSEPEGRILSGHSSGGWTVLWLQLNWPDVFGACWSSAPDPIDFTAFQKSNLYEDKSVYTMPDGTETPSYRMQVGLAEERVMMTVREEVLMELAIHPYGASGQQWDAWMAKFSPPDPETGYPKRLFESQTGNIDREVLEHWQQFDITRKVRKDWEQFGPIVQERVHLGCGKLDCFYLHRAVKRFRSMVEEHDSVAADDGTRGYITMKEFATHGSILRELTPRWNREMRDFFRNHGLHD